MKSIPLSPYAAPANHEAISDIIRKYSRNRVDVRAALLDGLDLSGAEGVLDLGCGFGFMGEAVATRIAPSGTIIGVDACAANRAAYLRHVGSSDRRARFIQQQLTGTLPCPNASFDAVIASYSLYFFPETIADVARVLRPHGVFVTVTHSPVSFFGLLYAIGLDPHEAGLHRLIRSFSSANGGSLLEQAFDDVRRVDYPNSLRFTRDDLEDFLAYVRFKLPFVLHGPDAGVDNEAELSERLIRAAAETLERVGEVTIEKDDTAFICRQPRHAS